MASACMAMGFVIAIPASSRAQEPAPASAEAAVPERRCMERHLREAAAINKARMPLYDSLSGGRSRGISRRLIWTERLGVVAAWYIDLRARRFQRAGIRIVCDDFVPMAHTPAFQPRAPDPPPPLADFVRADASGIRREVERAQRLGGWAAASAVLEREIEALAMTPAYHCMLRHLLESALRISNQAPRYAAEAEARGLSASPEDLSRALLDLHLLSLGDAAKLDARAAPLQAEGIPILCQDVPPIPPFAS
ncbi:MAG TPA: hypothetical protein VLK84_01295 [Longimicrobium sp.]|nr:hypothetical protein [Longimicrobium sp.]